ncbi:S41 family peptidase [Niabella drilacis]|uniref:Peptidase family S41 n=1 Tax=Niabella drilacis (strain DSM 25811 / CCM 8410 / CCUG 62505 / LMG 26954 / E90) TaxID=1285928 RepID=A0A1G6ZFU8_NIADE|nr:S41 family peptidase [Niabella drilacis]SDE01430.1 Peptidase family S41 [Niabella drilacis]
MILKQLVVSFGLIFFTVAVFGQSCDCRAGFDWMKKTFEQNDAGFQYIIDKKGKGAYDYHNLQIQEKVAKAKTYEECRQVMREWLNFFRRFHLSISLGDSVQRISDALQEAELQKAFRQVAPELIKQHEKIQWDDTYWNTYLKNIKEPGFEGLWFFSPFYKVAIVKKGTNYVGYILEGPKEAPLQKGAVKLKIYPVGNGYKSTIYGGNLKQYDSAAVKWLNDRFMQVGNFYFQKLDPLYPDSPEKAKYDHFLRSRTPLLERLSAHTVYLRLPGFNISQKRAIDSLLKANDPVIRSVPNLIVDVRDNGGGADDSYAELMKYLYTNPMREMAVETYATPLNNQRLLEYARDTNFSEQRRKSFLKEYEDLEQAVGKFVLLNKSSVSISHRDTVYPFPQRVAMIINGATGSSAEQLLVDAKQSLKVKLFGTSTLGSLDMSNMTEAASPGNEFVLTYATTKSLRLPGFMVDASGIQPDYFIDESIPGIGWIPFVQQTLEGN